MDSDNMGIVTISTRELRMQRRGAFLLGVVVGLALAGVAWWLLK